MFWTESGEQCIVVPMNSPTFPESQILAEPASEDSAPSAGIPSVPAKTLPSGGRGRRFESSRSDQKRQGIEGVSAALGQCAPVQRNRTTYIYAIKGDRLIKVGRARNVARRLGELQVGCPTPLKLLHAVGVPRGLAVSAEAAAHRHLERFWEIGEWFAVTADQAWYALEYASAVVRGREPPAVPQTKSPEEALAEWRASRARNRAERMAEIGAQREASKATFLAVREKFMAKRAKQRGP